MVCSIYTTSWIIAVAAADDVVATITSNCGGGIACLKEIIFRICWRSGGSGVVVLALVLVVVMVVVATMVVARGDCAVVVSGMVWWLEF